MTGIIVSRSGRWEAWTATFAAVTGACLADFDHPEKGPAVCCGGGSSVTLEDVSGRREALDTRVRGLAPTNSGLARRMARAGC